jgi:hypothetical protein
VFPLPVCELEEGDMTDKLDDIRSAHVELMVEYVHLINHASKLSFLLPVVIFPLQKALPVFNKLRVFVTNKLPVFVTHTEIYKFLIFCESELSPYTLKFLVKLFVESHIKGKLNQLADSYVQLAQSLSTNKPFDIKYQNWLTQAEEGTRKFANTLSSFRGFRGLFGAVLPWIASFLIAMLSANIIHQIFVKIAPISNHILIILGLILFILALSLCLVLVSAFIYKRNLFYPGSDGFAVESIILLLEFLKLREVPQQRDPAYNVYQLENKLFDLIGKKKILELPIDSILFSIFLFMYGTFWIILLISGQEVEFGIFFFVIAIFFVILILFGNIIIMAGFKRRWR